MATGLAASRQGLGVLGVLNGTTARLPAIVLQRISSVADAAAYGGKSADDSDDDDAEEQRAKAAAAAKAVTPVQAAM